MRIRRPVIVVVFVAAVGVATWRGLGVTWPARQDPGGRTLPGTTQGPLTRPSSPAQTTTTPRSEDGDQLTVVTGTAHLETSDGEFSPLTGELVFVPSAPGPSGAAALRARAEAAVQLNTSGEFRVPVPAGVYDLCILDGDKVTCSSAPRALVGQTSHLTLTVGPGPSFRIEGAPAVPV